MGQDRVEEVNYETLGRARGANFGWDAFEGNSLVDPPAPGDHDPSDPHLLARRRRLLDHRWLRGPRPRARQAARALLYGDFCKGQIRSLKPKLGGAGHDRSLGLPRIDGLSSFGVDDRRNVYVASLGGGVWRLARR